MNSEVYLNFFLLVLKNILLIKFDHFNSLNKFVSFSPILIKNIEN